MLALTATAAPPVREEIVERLGLRDAELVDPRASTGPNLRLAVERFHDERATQAARRCSSAVVAAPKPGIVYVATRREAEALAAGAARPRRDAAAYHAGMQRRRARRGAGALHGRRRST